MNIQAYWKTVLMQDASTLKDYFCPDAYVRWHNTNEQFTVEEFIKANCEYPNQWDGEIERLETIGDLIIAVVHVFSTNQPLSFHVTSFIQIKKDKISGIDEYWGDDGDAPQWRLDKKIGKPIR